MYKAAPNGRPSRTFTPSSRRRTKNEKENKYTKTRRELAAAKAVDFVILEPNK
jgi:hypothetical protein